MATSDDDVSELLDDDVLTSEYPPDRPLGVNQYGTTPQEERVDEPIAERVRREEPDFDEQAGTVRRDDDGVQLVDETEDVAGIAEVSDIDAGETGDEVLGETGQSDDGDDAQTGPSLGPPPDELASDRVPRSAEEAAVHVVDGDEAR
jgi:hypothetical protein